MRNWGRDESLAALLGSLPLSESKGGVPFNPFKSYAVGTTKSETWNRLHHYYALNRTEIF
jgi:hypothetical protein